MPSAEIIHGDCLDVMRGMADKSAIIVTDPPYGIGADRKHHRAAQSQKRYGVALAPKRNYGDTNWDHDRPAAEVFSEILRVGRDAVVFGGNYFADLLPPSPSWIVWDKDNGTTKFADCELAWTSHKRAVRKLTWRWNGMLQQPGQPKDKRLHPTQKPLGVMLWVIEHYTQPGDLVVDPFCGSGTTGVACAMRGRRFVGIEREASYVAIARQRIADAQAQTTLGVA